MRSSTFPALERPPVVEVVCGIVFEPLTLDGMDLGVYWDARKDEYPEHSLQPALTDENTFILVNSPLRAVLVASDKVRILQLQHDRFFMNWRAVGEQYPRFSNREGGVGLLVQALAEFDKFSQFCAKRLSASPSPTRVELAKIDMIERGKHWEDLADLAKLVPITGTFDDVHRGGNRELRLRFVEHSVPERLIVTVNSILKQPAGEVRAVRIETRAVRTLEAGEQPESAFVAANQAVNGAFFKLLNTAELGRFSVEGGRK